MVSTDEGRQIAREIEIARRNRRPKLSVRAAADHAGISEGWWRQLAVGYQRRGNAEVPVVGSPDTYLAMAAVVGIEHKVRQMLGDEAPPEEAISGAAETSRNEGSHIEMDELEAAIMRSDRLIEEAKQHLLNQYALLLRVPPRQTSVPRDKQDHQPLRAVARGGDPKDRAEVSRRAQRVREEHDREQRGKE